MKKILLTADEAAGNGSPEPKPTAEKKAEPATKPAAPPKAEPPVTAKIVAAGKTERELMLERHNAKLLKAARKISDEKIAVEKNAAEVIRENQLLKQREQAVATKQKMSWMGFTS